MSDRRDDWADSLGQAPAVRSTPQVPAGPTCRICGKPKIDDCQSAIIYPTGAGQPTSCPNFDVPRETEKPA